MSYLQLLNLIKENKNIPTKVMVNDRVFKLLSDPDVGIIDYVSVIEYEYLSDYVSRFYLTKIINDEKFIKEVAENVWGHMFKFNYQPGIH